jgi:hypothetical protein
MKNFEEKYNLSLEAGKDFRVIENHRIPQKMGVEFFVFGKTMYCSGTMDALPDHEFLHIAQFKKFGKVLVVLHYFFYLMLNMLRYRNFGAAFQAVPFEIEARDYAKKRQEELKIS